MTNSGDKYWSKKCAIQKVVNTVNRFVYNGYKGVNSVN